MANLKRLKQREEGTKVYLFGEGNFVGKLLSDVFPVGALRTITIPLPRTSIENVLEERFHQNPDFVPKGAEGYAITDFDTNTYFNREGENFSTHALQFYRIVKN